MFALIGMFVVFLLGIYASKTYVKHRARQEADVPVESFALWLKGMGRAVVEIASGHLGERPRRPGDGS